MPGAAVESRDGRLYLSAPLDAHAAAIFPILERVAHTAGLRVSTMPDGSIFRERAPAAG